MKSYVLEWNAAYKDQTPAEEGGNWSRQEIRLVKDFPSAMVRASAGDLTYPDQLFPRIPNYGRLRRDDHIWLAALQAGGTERKQYVLSEKTPSTVTVIRNGERLQSFDLPAGTHSIKELPVSVGINQITLEIRDQFGQVEVVNIPVNVASLSLAEGLHQFTYNVGYESMITTDDIIYDSSAPVYSFYHRYGLTNNLTVGASFQGDPTHEDQGLEALVSGRYGSLELDLGRSFLAGTGSGYAWRLLYNYDDDNRPSNKKSCAPSKRPSSGTDGITRPSQTSTPNRWRHGSTV